MLSPFSAHLSRPGPSVSRRLLTLRGGRSGRRRHGEVWGRDAGGRTLAIHHGGGHGRGSSTGHRGRLWTVNATSRLPFPQAVSPFCFVYRRMSKVLAFFKLARKCGESLVSKFKTCNEWFTKNALLGLIALQLLQTKPGNQAGIT